MSSCSTLTGLFAWIRTHAHLHNTQERRCRSWRSYSYFHPHTQLRDHLLAKATSKLPHFIFSAWNRLACSRHFRVMRVAPGSSAVSTGRLSLFCLVFWFKITHGRVFPLENLGAQFLCGTEGCWGRRMGTTLGPPQILFGLTPEAGVRFPATQDPGRCRSEVVLFPEPVLAIQDCDEARECVYLAMARIPLFALSSPGSTIHYSLEAAVERPRPEPASPRCPAQAHRLQPNILLSYGLLRESWNHAPKACWVGENERVWTCRSGPWERGRGTQTCTPQFQLAEWRPAKFSAVTWTDCVSLAPKRFQEFGITVLTLIQFLPSCAAEQLKKRAH